MNTQSPTIRRATTDDFEAVAQIHFQSHTVSFAAFASQSWLDSRKIDDYVERWRDTLSNSNSKDVIWVAVVSGEIVGCVRVAPETNSEFDAQLTSMHVSPSLIGTGIGTLLMRQAMRHIEEQGFARTQLGVIAANTRARRFYESHGWKLAREFPTGVEGVPTTVYTLG